MSVQTFCVRRTPESVFFESPESLLNYANKKKIKEIACHRQPTIHQSDDDAIETAKKQIDVRCNLCLRKCFLIRFDSVRSSLSLNLQLNLKFSSFFAQIKNRKRRKLFQSQRKESRNRFVLFFLLLSTHVSQLKIRITEFGLTVWRLTSTNRYISCRNVYKIREELFAFRWHQMKIVK